MNVTEHERPGVYSVYDASSPVSGRKGAGAVGVMAPSATGKLKTVYTVTDRARAVEYFGEESPLTRLAEVALKNGAAKVYALPLSEDEDCAGGIKLMDQVEDLKVLVCSSSSAKTLNALKESLESTAAARRERLAVVFYQGSDSLSVAMSQAQFYNNERMIFLCSGSVYTAAAMAGAIAGETDPAMPLGGVELKGLPETAATNWTDADIDAMVRGGITPIECVGGKVSVVRAVTTRCRAGEAADATWRELTTIRIVDDVVPGLRNALRSRFTRAKNTEQGRGAIRSQVIVELEKKKNQEIITGYDNVTVSALEEDPTVCLVEFNFAVAHGLNQIWLSAHITV